MEKTVKKYVYHVVVALDQFFNALIGGAADETLSSRTYRRATLKEKPLKRWRVLYHMINGLFFDRNHCKEAYFSEVYRRQYTEDFEQKTAK